VTRHQLETAFVIVLLTVIFGFVALAMDPATDTSGRAMMVLAWLGISAWTVYEREFRRRVGPGETSRRREVLGWALPQPGTIGVEILKPLEADGITSPSFRIFR
jgi:hypothetical protein